MFLKTHSFLYKTNTCHKMAPTNCRAVWRETSSVSLALAVFCCSSRNTRLAAGECSSSNASSCLLFYKGKHCTRRKWTFRSTLLQLRQELAHSLYLHHRRMGQRLTLSYSSPSLHSRRAPGCHTALQRVRKVALPHHA